MTGWTGILATLPLLLLPWTASAAGQEPDSLRHRRVALLTVPAFGHSPETGTYLGGVGLASFRTGRDSLARASVAKAEFNYTWKKQYIADLGWDVFTREEKFYLKGRFTWSDYPDYYWGFGVVSSPGPKVRYDSRRLAGEFHLLKSLPRSRFLGLSLRYQDYMLTDRDSLALYPELASSTVTGAGFRLVTEKRNSLLTPTSGRYSDVSFTLNRYRNHDYVRLGVDLRYYLTLRGIHTLAGRVYGLFTGGSPPFHDLALLGGDNLVRGYYFGKYRARHLATLQAEFRSTIYRRWGYALFCGLSGMNDGLAGFGEKYLKPNYGAGLRFVVDRKERISLRIDYAKGAGVSDGFYVSFGEAF